MTERLQPWQTLLWCALVVATSIIFTVGIACAVPFVGLCVAAACLLARRDAFIVAGAAWAANQCIGFAFLNYPLSATCLVWSAVLGLCALLTTWAASRTLLALAERQPVARYTSAFLAGFVTYEVILVGFSLILGGMENFTLGIQFPILVINAGTFVGLYALHFGIATVGKLLPVAAPANSEWR